MKIYTKTGDEGTTGLFGGQRLSKSDLRIDAYGTVDELNSYIGLVRDQRVNETRQAELIEIQDRLFTMGSMLATDSGNRSVKIPHLHADDILFLERAIDGMEVLLSPMKSFILPGGHVSVSTGHVARTVCRRAERVVIALHHLESVDLLVIKYLNRLSDYLFVLCRLMTKELSALETPWKARM